METPDYIRRTIQRNRVAPLELFPGRDDGFTSDCEISPRVEEPPPEVDGNCDKVGIFDASIELGVIPEVQQRSLGINAGCENEPVVYGGADFEVDKFYSGGDTLKTDAQVGNGGDGLYQSARFGNFSYQFPEFQAGDYIIDLHFAEIVFVEGPPGVRVFNVFIQREKVSMS